VPHPSSAQPDPQQQKEGEVIPYQGDVADLGIREPPEEEIGDTHQERRGGGIDHREADLEEAVQPLDEVHESRHRIGHESEMPDDDDQKRPMHEEAPKPEGQVGSIHQATPLHELGLRVPQ
jgi:hypothetical protein